ncbi:MAG: hypothetical protein K6T30_00015 [Alicyclobacillus sp.]|nr:hypothetical protein [Alicyclobacillus sp.]
MIVTVEWLPLGHITHGYRRVFTVREADVLRHVVIVAPMPYEQVFQVKQLARGQSVEDPALWWGLSTVLTLMADGTLLNPGNQDLPDDGCLQVRPQPAVPERLLPLEEFRRALQAGRWSYER